MLKRVDVRALYGLTEEDESPCDPDRAMRHEDFPMLEPLVWKDRASLDAEKNNEMMMIVTIGQMTAVQAMEGNKEAKK
jgi:hypothetical protein